jgi:integrase
MLLSGARKSEALTARWEDFNLELGVWTKPSHHTKQKRTEHVPLSAPAVQLLVSLKEKADGNAHLFPSDVAEQPLNEIKWAWAKLCKLRHTYASHLVSSRMSLPIVGRLLGHTQPQTPRVTRTLRTIRSARRQTVSLQLSLPLDPGSVLRSFRSVAIVRRDESIAQGRDRRARVARGSGRSQDAIQAITDSFR